MTLAMFLVARAIVRYPSLDADGLFPTTLAASPFILSGLVGGIFISLLYLLLVWRRKIWSAASQLRTTLIASPTKRFALPSLY